MIERLPKKEMTAFARKNVTSDMQIRRWLPIRYVDNTVETGLAPEYIGEHVVIVSMLLTVDADATRDGRQYLRMKLQDRKSGFFFTAFLFGQAFMYSKLQSRIGSDLFITGKLKYDDRFGYSVVPVDLEVYAPGLFRVVPVFSKVKGISDNTIRSTMKKSMSMREPETVPEPMRDKYHIKEINEAVNGLIEPQGMSDVRAGKLRLLFDDLFYMAAQFELKERSVESLDIRVAKTDIMDEVKLKLPFALTKDQETIVTEIVNEFKNGKNVDALVQGDVGCGKTISAFLPMIAVAENGYQACIAAPTRILAEQHYKKLTELLAGTGIDVRCFSGAKISKTDKEALASGECQIAVGTHSLFQEGINFSRLRLLVIDEEQKFGVVQRETLSTKSRGISTISMSATPIPRTLALSLYGSKTKIFTIKTMPAGRRPIITQYDNGQRRQMCVNYILQKGQQVYVVCPAIGDDETKKDIGVLTVAKAKAMYQQLLPGAVIETLDGTMKEADTADVLQRFHDGKVNVLISTTVVEVGVDVPNATLMIIENAERFGLSQMHQLRGRVGRNSLQSFCLLISEKPPAENKRIEVLCGTTDGFLIAEKDLQELRKSGDLFGEEQSGRNVYVEEMLLYKEAFRKIREDVKSIPDKTLEKHVRKMGACDIKGHKKVIIL